MASQNIVVVTDSNFESEVVKSSLPVLVDFWATWCTPCLALAPHVEALAQEYAGKIRVGKCDIDANPWFQPNSRFAASRPCSCSRPARWWARWWALCLDRVSRIWSRRRCSAAADGGRRGRARSARCGQGGGGSRSPRRGVGGRTPAPVPVPASAPAPGYLPTKIHASNAPAATAASITPMSSPFAGLAMSAPRPNIGFMDWGKSMG